jgi:glycosyltransferase involved in cell wall biosynthesis
LSDLPRLLLCSFDVIPGPSGSSRRLTEYLRALPDRFSVVVLSAKTPDHSHIEKYQGARLLRVPVGTGDLGSRIQAFERAVRRQLESEEYALVHFTDPFGGYALCETKSDYGHRLIYEAQSFPSLELRHMHPQLEGDRRFLSKVRRQELFCLMNADLVLTGSPITRDFIHSLGVGQESVRVVRAPVDLEPYPPHALGAPDGHPMRLVYLGSQVPWQGLPGLLRGLALASRQVDVRLSIIGPRHPDWQPQLEDLVKELGLGERVDFQPPVGHDDVAKVLALGDVGVLPLDDVDRNRIQGGPLSKVSEYLAAGRPVLAADLPVARELVPASAGVFYPPGEPQALADHIIELARDVSQRVALGRQARAFAEQRLDASLIRGQLLDIYDVLLGKRERPVEPPPEPSLTMTGTPTSRVPALSASEPSPAPVPLAPDAPPAEGGAPSEEPPLVVGQVERDEALDNRLVKTDPDLRPDGPPVVLGLPLREPSSPESAPTETVPQPDAPPVVLGLPLREPSSPESTPSEPVPQPDAAPVAPSLPPLAPSSPIVDAPEDLTELAPEDLAELAPEDLAPEDLAELAPEDLAELAPEDLAELAPDDIHDADIHEVDTNPTFPYKLPPRENEKLKESSGEKMEKEAPALPPREPPESQLNPWFAQLAHGYCPPEGTRFARHPPPTNFPGREEVAAPPPSAPAPRVSRGKPS